MNDFLVRVRVLLGALPTYLAAATAVLTVVAVEVVPLLPEDLGLQVAGWVAAVLGVIGSVVLVVQRLTPYVGEPQLLPPPPPPPPGDL